MALNCCQIAMGLEISTKMENGISSQKSAKWNFRTPYAFKRKHWQTSKEKAETALHEMDYIFSNKSNSLAMNQ